MKLSDRAIDYIAHLFARETYDEESLPYESIGDSLDTLWYGMDEDEHKCIGNFVSRMWQIRQTHDPSLRLTPAHKK